MTNFATNSINFVEQFEQFKKLVKRSEIFVQNDKIFVSNSKNDVLINVQTSNSTMFVNDNIVYIYNYFEIEKLTKKKIYDRSKKKFMNYLRTVSLITIIIFALQKIKIKRTIMLRNKQMINLNCAKNFKTILTFTVEKREKKCDKCEKNKKIFVKCISIEKQLHFSCNNCHYNFENDKCFLRSTKNT